MVRVLVAVTIAAWFSSLLALATAWQFPGPSQRTPYRDLASRLGIVGTASAVLAIVLTLLGW